VSNKIHSLAMMNDTLFWRDSKIHQIQISE
jgi:hypothetical protein